METKSHKEINKEIQLNGLIVLLMIALITFVSFGRI